MLNVACWMLHVAYVEKGVKDQVSYEDARRDIIILGKFP